MGCSCSYIISYQEGLQKRMAQIRDLVKLPCAIPKFFQIDRYQTYSKAFSCTALPGPEIMSKTASESENNL